MTPRADRITLVCSNCSIKFERLLSEHRDRVARGIARTFCSMKCRGSCQVKRREPVIDGEIAIVPLSNGMSAIIDVADVGVAAGFNWSATQAFGSWYACRGLWPSGKKVYLHRLVAASSGLDVDGKLIDHRDHDGLNCRRSNLRLATRSQNGMNRRVPAIGVSRVGPSWKAAIQVSGKRINLGSFRSLREAMEARQLAAIKFHGEFASIPACDVAIAGCLAAIEGGS